VRIDEAGAIIIDGFLDRSVDVVHGRSLVTPQEGQSEAKAPKAIGAGRGLVFITAAKLWFMFAGYAVEFALPRALGSPAAFGVWKTILSLVSPINNVMTTATIQGVARFTAEKPERAPAVTRAGLRMHLFLGVGIALLFTLGAPLTARFLKDASLVPLLAVAAVVIAAYALYSVFVGTANGTLAFHKQAALDVSFATLRVALVVGAAVVTHAVLAAVGGFAAAAVLILGVAWLAVGVGPRPAEPFPAARVARFFAAVGGYLLILNLLMFVDGLLLKRLVTEWAARLGKADPVSLANTQVGLYGAVQTLARLPYQLTLAVTFVIFPLVSRSAFEKDVARMQGYVRVTLRYSLVVVALLAVGLAVRPEALLRLVYKPEYAVGAAALPLLCAGYVCFSLLNIAGTILNGAGHTRSTLLIALVTLGADAAANWLVLRWALDAGRDPLFYAAAATTSAMALGLILMLGELVRRFGAGLPPLTLVRVGLAIAAAAALGRFWPTGGFLGSRLGTLIAAALAGLVYIVVVVLTREVRPREIVASRRR
jgi:stage V sporulation protein B